MKTRFTICLAIVLAICAQVKAQYVISYSWDLTGNNLSSNSSFLGTTNSYPLVFKTNNTTRMTLSAYYPYLGLGTSSPAGNLHVHSNSATNTFLMTNTAVNPYAYRGFRIDLNQKKVYIKQQENDNMYIQTPGGGLTISSNGNVGVGTNNPKAKLSVEGAILAKEVCVKDSISNWPDYVFKEEYNLMDLKALKEYVNTNKHLPDIPSAEEIETNGVKLGETTSLLMQKIEELTLYIIQLEERIQTLEGGEGDLKE